MSFPMKCSEIFQPGIYQIDYEKHWMKEVCRNSPCLLTACPTRREDKLVLSYTASDDNTKGKPSTPKVKKTFKN